MASIRQLESGNWQAQVRRAGRPQAAKSFKTRAEACKWARILESEIDQGVFLDRSEAQRVTIGELIDRYLVEVTPLKKSARSETQRLRGLRCHFGAYSLAVLRNSHIADYRDVRLAKGVAGATVVKELNSLSHLIDVAIKDWGLPLASNPAKLVRRPSVARGRDRRLVGDEEQRLLDACRASRSVMLPAVVTFAIETGMRMGEILSLEWRNLDIASRIATLLDSKNGERCQTARNFDHLSAANSDQGLMVFSCGA